MKIAVIICLSCLFTASVVSAGQDIALPKIEAKIGMEHFPAFACYDVLKNPKIEEDFKRYEKHLKNLF